MNCRGPGATHHAGCDCWNERIKREAWNAAVDACAHEVEYNVDLPWGTTTKDNAPGVLAQAVYQLRRLKRE